MATIHRLASVSRSRLWSGRVLSAIVVLFLVFDAAIKVLRVPAVVEGSAQAGFSESDVVAIGVTLIACVALYAIPRTSLAGAILLTGYLGGAIATHVRLDSPLLSHTLFPIYVAALAWGGLALRRGWGATASTPSTASAASRAGEAIGAPPQLV